MSPGAQLQAIRTQNGTIPNSSLHIRSITPQSRSLARLAILHGYGDHSGRYSHFMTHLAQRGIACHALDFTGHGLSRGRRGFVRSWDQFLSDTQTFLRAEMFERGEAPLFLLGHSHGALVLAMAGIEGLLAAHNPAGCIFSAPYFQNRVRVRRAKLALARVCNHVIPWLPIRSGIPAQWLSSDPSMMAERDADPLALRIATPRWFMTMQAAQRRALAQARLFTHPMLMLIPGADPIANPAASEQFFLECGSADKEIHRYPAMMHEILRESGREAIFDRIVDWIIHRNTVKAHERDG
jgi:lysophospholipase